MTAEYDVVCNLHCELGEGPLWCARENAIYWVDILSQALHRVRLTDRVVTSWQMPEKIGWVVERRAHPGFICGLQSGFAELRLDPFEIRHIVDPEPQHPGNRMNDAKVDHLGRIWAGTMDVEIKQATGSLYRLDADRHVHAMDSGYLITNGPAFSPDHSFMYHTDTGLRTVYRFELTPQGELTNKSVFITFREEWGKPDGMTVDAQGGIWIAHFGGGRVSRFTPDGQLDREICLPASQLTSCVFAGEQLDRMLVTSAAAGLGGTEALAGALFEVDPGGVRGITAHRFAG